MLAATLALPSDSSAATFYRSDFASQPNGPAQLADWALTGGTYTLEDGWLRVTSEKSNPYAALKATLDGDGTFRATVRNARENHWCALLARGVYRLEVNNEFVRLALLRKVGEEWKLVGQVGSYELYAHNTQQFELRLTIVGRRVLGFIDGKQLIEYEDPDPAPPAGEVALMSGWGTNLAWRDVSLSDEPDTSQWPTETPPSPAPANLVEVTWVRCTSPDSIYFDGQPAGVRLRLRAPANASSTLILEYRLTDLWQKPVEARRETVALAAGEERELLAEFRPPRRGWFKVALWAGRSPQDLGWIEDLGSFTVLPKAVYDAPRNPDSYFGGHMDGINLEWHLQVGRKLGIQWARCHDMMQQTWWRRIQPDSPDQWIWFDDGQKLIDGLGFFTSGEFMWTPKWATSAAPDAPGNPETYPPKDWDDFERYVYQTVSHYRGSIHHWEVWNEPHYNGFWSGTAEQYAKLMAIAYREAKRADPTCTVIGGGGTWVRGMRWITATLDATSGKAMDAYSIHYLEPDIAAERMPLLRRVLNEHGVSGPIWDTEENVPSTSSFDQIRRGHMEPEARYHFRNACSEFVRCYMEALSSGVQRIFYYEQADPWRFREFPKARRVEELPYGDITGSMWDECRMLKPVAAAHAALAFAIEGRTFRERIDKGDLHAFIFEGKDSATAVQYATLPSFAQREEVRLPIPQGARAEDFTVTDAMGNERRPRVEAGKIVLLRAREPVYVMARGAHAAAMLAAVYRSPP